MEPRTDSCAPLYVLFADDDPAIVTLFKMYGESRGWKVETASRPKEILDKVNRNCDDKGLCFDAIVTDINFLDPNMLEREPRVTGTHIIRQIRKKYPRIPVVFYTGFDNLLTRKQAALAGGDYSDYVVKSSPEQWERNKSEFDRLLDRVENLHNWVKARDEMTFHERRVNAHNETLYHRRKSDTAPVEEVRVSPILERLLRGSRILLRGGEPSA